MNSLQCLSQRSFFGIEHFCFPVPATTLEMRCYLGVNLVICPGALMYYYYYSNENWHQAALIWNPALGAQEGSKPENS
jgi:hypothetical protein